MDFFSKTKLESIDDRDSIKINCDFCCIFVLHITGTNLIPLFIFLFAPTAITNYQMALQYGGDDILARDFLVYSMFFSVVTMFCFIYLLKPYHFI